ncbi:BAR/IMD domain-containing adapter protein 2-like 2 [Pholidichthys leucotaenia]
MSGMSSDQLHRSTLRVYSSLTEEFNPCLLKLVSLGNGYVQAFKTLAAASEAYFSALSKIGEQAFLTVSSRSLGDILVQISDSQRKLTLEMEGVFQQFNMEVQQMGNNIRLDRDYISTVNQHLCVPVRYALNVCTLSLQENYTQFLRDSYSEALKEEERRYRFLAERHCGLVQSIAHLMNKTGGALQQRATAWTEEVSSTRVRTEARRPTVDNTQDNVLCHKAKMVQEWFEERNIESEVLTWPPNSPDLNPVEHLWDLLDKQIHGGPTSELTGLKGSAANILVSDTTAVPAVGMMEQIRMSRDDVPLGNIPSRAPSPQGSVYRFGADSSEGGGGGRTMRARADHQPSGSNPTLLPFNRGQRITVMVKQPRNGWLYGRTDNSSRPGWFPASFAEVIDDPPVSVSTRYSTSYKTGALWLGALLNDTSSFFLVDAWRKLQLLMGTGRLSEYQRSQPHESRPELFPRGTNPFATVKLKPTTTNDRSAPQLYRR